MAIFTPYESRENISTANFQPQRFNASDFATPMPQALQQLAQGAEKLTGVIADIDLQKRQRQDATDMLAAQVAETDAARSFAADYQQKNKGVEARNAVQDADKFFQSRMDGLRQRWGNDPDRWLIIEKMMAPIRQQGLNHAQAYSSNEDELYTQGTQAAKLAQVLADAKDPSVPDADAIANFRDYALSAKLVAGGRNVDAQLITAWQHVKEARWQAEAANVLSMPPDQAGQLIRGDGKPQAANLPVDVEAEAEAAAARYNLDPAIFKALIHTESGGNNDAVSPKGAQGLTGLMPDTAKELGVDPKNPKQNIDGGGRYLRQMLDKYGDDYRKALPAYNWGPGNYDSFLETGKGKKGQDVPKETLEYTGKVLSRASKSGLKWGTQQQRDALERQIEARDSHLLALEERETKRQREAAGKDLYAMAYDGKLTRDAVEAQRDVLTGEEYNKFLKLTRGGALPDKSDPDAIIHLTNMATGGNADLQDTADEMLRHGKLTIGDYRAAINEGQQFRDPIVKQVLQDIKDLTGASEMNPKEGAKESFVNARRDFYELIDTEAWKKASPKERLEMGRSIANSYRITNTDKTLLTVPLPSLLVGTKAQPDIDATIDKIEEEKAAGRLTDEQYKREMTRIKRMADILAERDRDKKAQGTATTKRVSR